MRKRLVLIALAVALAGTACLLGGKSLAQVIYTYVPVYSIIGTVVDNPASSSVGRADGSTVVFFRNLSEYNSGVYSSDIVGPTGSMAAANKYLINATNNQLLPLVVGNTYQVATIRDADNYGAGPVEVTISGAGYDVAPDMTMALGGGVGPPGVTAQPPVIKQVWFGNRIYQKTLVASGEQFVVGPTPTIKANIEATGTSGINASNITILVNEGTTKAKTYTMAAADITQTVYATAAKDVIQSLAVEYSIPETDPLPENEDSIVTVRAWDASNTASTSEACTVTVLGGPLRIVGPVVVYPSPFSQRRHGTCTIQYTLSADANIDIYIYAVGGQLVKKISRFSGTDGGSAGINKVVWDGRTESGMLAGNAVYVGTLVGRDENKLLAKFKFTILD